MNPVSARLPVSSISRSSPTRGFDLRALGRRALVVPEDRRAQHALVGVEDDEPVHLPREPDRPFGSRARQACAARHQSSGSCSAHPGCGVESG